MSSGRLSEKGIVNDTMLNSISRALKRGSLLVPAILQKPKYESDITAAENKFAALIDMGLTSLEKSVSSNLL